MGLDLNLKNWESRASKILAGGVTHDSWARRPFPLVYSKAKGPYKWSTNGEKFIDLWMGHGSLFFGHGDEEVTQALRDQIDKGTHLAGNHTLLVEWAEEVISLMPSIEKIRFCASGTEATYLALRAARALTNRPKVVRIDGHFHGWHDEALVTKEGTLFGQRPMSNDFIEVIPGDCLPSLETVLSSKNVAAVILEPGGGSGGSLNWSKSYLFELRKLTKKYGTLLIFDEVMSGFRYSPGGVQALCGVLPDFTTLSKILCGGLPGAALGGTKEAMEVFDTSHPRKIVHSGTYNGNPLSSVAGLTTLRKLRDGHNQKVLDERAIQFSKEINLLALKKGVDVRMISNSSIIHLMAGAVRNEMEISPSTNVVLLTQHYREAYEGLRDALSWEGIDMHPTHGWLSMSHTDEVIEEILKSFSRVFDDLREVPFFAL